MNTQNPQIPPVAAPAAVPAPVAPAAAPVTAPVIPAEGSQNQQPLSGTPPVVPAAQAPVDPLANSSWPNSAKDKVRDLARKNREKADLLAQKDGYIKQLEEQATKAVHPRREQFPEGDAGDHAFVSAISLHNATLGGLSNEKIRATSELNTAKADVQKSQQDLVQERLNVARTEFPDLEQVVQASQLPVSQHLGHALQIADNGYQMMYILNKMPPTETARLNQLTWPEILQELPQIEARFRASQNKPAPAAQPAAAPIAPPIEPIGGDGGFPSSGNGYKEWEAERNKKESIRF